MDMTLIQGAVAGLKTAGDIAKGFLELKSMADVQGKVIDLQSTILAAQSSAIAAQSEQFTMTEKIRDLEKEIGRVKAWGTEQQRYQLVSPWIGSVAYALKESMSASEPPHYLCTKCYEDGRKSILNPNSNLKGSIDMVCPICISLIPTHSRRSYAKYAEHHPINPIDR